MGKKENSRCSLRDKTGQLALSWLPQSFVLLETLAQDPELQVNYNYKATKAYNPITKPDSAAPTRTLCSCVHLFNKASACATSMSACHSPPLSAPSASYSWQDREHGKHDQAARQSGRSKISFLRCCQLTPRRLPKAFLSLCGLVVSAKGSQSDGGKDGRAG